MQVLSLLTRVRVNPLFRGLTQILVTILPIFNTPDCPVQGPPNCVVPRFSAVDHNLGENAFTH